MLLGASRSLRLSPSSLRSIAPCSMMLRMIDVRSARLATTQRRGASRTARRQSTSTSTRSTTAANGDVSPSTPRRSDDADNDPNDKNSTASTSNLPPPPPKQWKLKLLHDSDCPLCEREVKMLKRRDAERRNAILFVDVADPGYDASQNNGIGYEAAMRTIHGVVREEDRRTGEAKETVLTGVDVFRRAYDLVGLGFVYAFLDVPVLRALASALYDAWARVRLPLTGRPALEVVLAEKRTCRPGDAGGSE